jgi:Coenzyme PQQ synthesis protein D (PqqD)
LRAGTDQILPFARTDQLIVQELPDELLVYDLARHEAHCLNRSAAAVWKHCDGETTVGEMARLLKTELSAPVGTDVVWLALSQLRKFHLLDEGDEPFLTMRVSRRDLVRKYLPAALALPLILSIPAPAAAQAGSCRPDGAACTTGADCCSACCPGGTTCQPTFNCIR